MMLSRSNEMQNFSIGIRRNGKIDLSMLYFEWHILASTKAVYLDSKHQFFFPSVSVNSIFL